MKVADVMTRGVIGVSPETTVAEAVNLMLSSRISGLPVVDKGKLVGIVTEGDLIRRAELGTERRVSWWRSLLMTPGKEAEEYVLSHAAKVDDVMTTDVDTVTPESDLVDAVDLMNRRAIKRLPVVEGDRLVGIMSRADLLRALAAKFDRQKSGDLSDTEIRDAVRTELGRHPWGRDGFIEVHVRAGIVELEGTIYDERTRAAARVAAESVPGVKSVTDHLVWIEPMSGVVMLPPDVEGPYSR